MFLKISWKGDVTFCVRALSHSFSQRTDEMAKTSVKAALTCRVESLNQGLLITKKQPRRHVRQPSLAEK
jgi:hypothetical protein